MAFRQRGKALFAAHMNKEGTRKSITVNSDFSPILPLMIQMGSMPVMFSLGNIMMYKY